MPTYSDDEVFGSAPEQSGGNAPAKPTYSDEDVFGPPTLGDKAAAGTKRGIGGAAALADMVLGLPGQALQVGANLGGRIRGMAEGLNREGQARTGELLSAQVPEILTNPVTKLMKLAGFGEDYTDNEVTQVLQSATTMLAKGGEWVERQTGGVLTAKDTESLVNTTLFALGAKGTAAGVDPKLKAMGRVAGPEGQFDGAFRGRVDPKKLDPKEMGDPTKQTGVGTTSSPADVRVVGEAAEPKAHADFLHTRTADSTMALADARVNAETQAYNLMQSGASKQKVDQIIKKNPMVGEALDRMIEARKGSAEAFGQIPDGSPIRPDGTFAPHALSAMLKKGAEATPEELALREKAAGVTRGPLGEPIVAGEPSTGRGRPGPRPPTSKKGQASSESYRGSQGEVIEVPQQYDSMGMPKPNSKLLAITGATGLGLAAYYLDGDKEDIGMAAAAGMFLQGKGKSLSLGEIAAHADSAPLKTFLDASPTTLNTLEKLPSNRFTFPVQMIQDLLKRPEITQAERDVFTQALKEAPEGAKEITAKQLMAGVKKATGDWELGKKSTDSYADYGLEQIDRKIADDGDWIPEGATAAEEAAIRADSEAARAGSPKATTSIWQLPSHMEMSDANHFRDPRYFGHTRSFEEGGVKHVVEIQSDLAQKAGKVLGEAERAALLDAAKNVHAQVIHVQEFQRDLKTPSDPSFLPNAERLVADLEKLNPDARMVIGEELQKQLRNNSRAYAKRISADPWKTLEDAFHVGRTGDGDIAYDLNAAIKTYHKQINLLLEEHGAKLRDSAVSTQIGPMLKHWYKRLVREELADTARGLNPKRQTEEARIAKTSGPGYTTREERAFLKAKHALGLTPETVETAPIVRFATADTVAKVEGWRDTEATRQAQLVESQMRLISSQAHLAALERMKRGEAPKDEYYSALKTADPEGYARVLKHIDGELDYAREALREAQLQFDSPTSHEDFINASLREYEKRLRKDAAGDSEATAKIPRRLATAQANTKKVWEKHGKVFKWPEHAGLYLSYANEVTTFLNQLGGKPYTDSAGHTWIEVPTSGSKTHPAGPRVQQFGGATPQQMAAVGLITGGAVVGVALDKDRPIEGAIVGALAGALSTAATPKRLAKAAKATTAKDLGFVAAAAGVGATFSADDRLSGAAQAAIAAALFRAIKYAPKDTRIRIDTPANFRDEAIKKDTIAAVLFQRTLLDRVPDPARQAAITSWLDGNKAVKLSPVEAQAARELKSYYSQMLDAAKKAGVVEAGYEHYSPRVIEFKGKEGESAFLRWLGQRGGSGGAGTSSPFAKERTFPTIAELKASPLYKDGTITLKTENAAELMGIYADSMSRAIHNSNLLTAIKGMKTPLGEPLVMPLSKAPHTYKTLPHSQLRALAVHPDIEGSMKFLFDSHMPATWQKALEGFSSTTKLVAVMGSLFHATSLGYAYAGSAGISPKNLAKGAAVGAAAGFALNDPQTYAMIGAGIGMFAPAVKLSFQAVRGTHPIFKEINAKGGGESVNRAIRDGVEFSIERHPGVEDTHSGAFIAMMEDAQRFLDSRIPGAVKATAGNTVKFIHAFDKYMWSRLHTTLKLATYESKYQELVKNNEAYAQKTGKPGALEKDLGAAAASYTNDMFGGLNWRRIAEASQTRFGRDFAQEMLKPGSRRVAQILLFAPDWALSTTRAFTQAFREGSGIKGLVSPRELADLHRQYIMRSALFYLLAGDGLNYAMSGKHLWDEDNKDWTRIDMGDGRTLGFNKHAMEAVHLLKSPVQFGAGKLGYVPKEIIAQLTGKEYLSATGKAPPMDTSTGGRLAHAARGLLPIAAQSSAKTGSAADAVMGTLGLPIYGESKTAKAARLAKKEKEKKEAYWSDEEVRAREKKRREKERQMMQEFAR